MASTCSGKSIWAPPWISKASPMYWDSTKWCKAKQKLLYTFFLSCSPNFSTTIAQNLWIPQCLHATMLALLATVYSRDTVNICYLDPPRDSRLCLWHHASQIPCSHTATVAATKINQQVIKTRRSSVQTNSSHRYHTHTHCHTTQWMKEWMHCIWYICIMNMWKVMDILF